MVFESNWPAALIHWSIADHAATLSLQWQLSLTFFAEAFIKQLSSYEIISPLRVNDFGESFPHKLHYRRRRRSLNDDMSGLRVHYRIDAFGERFHLNLTADSDFIAPSYTVTHIGAEQSNATDSHFHDPSDMRHCFFRGHVNAKSDFPAVFSLCTGLVSSHCLLSLYHSLIERCWQADSIHARPPITRSWSEVCKSVTRASVAGQKCHGGEPAALQPCSPASQCLWRVCAIAQCRLGIMGVQQSWCDK